MTGSVPEAMRAAVYVGDGRIEVQERPVPELGPDDVLVEVSHCGICGTDLHLVLERYARAGSILGHEWSGTVASIGREAGGWKIGTRVVWNPSPACGECRACLRGRPSVCLRRGHSDLLAFNGAFCHYVAVPAANLLAVPEGLDPRVAALVEPTAIALHAISLVSADLDACAAGEQVLVTGAGPVGLLITAALRAQGVDRITVTDPSPARRLRAQAVGATSVLEPSELPSAPMGRPVEEPYAVAFECSGRSAAAESALDQLDSAGVLVFVGTGSQAPELNHNRMIVLELSAIGTYNYDASGFGPALELLASGRLPTDLLVEGRDVPLSGVLAAMQDLADGSIPSKLLVAPSAR